VSDYRQHIAQFYKNSLAAEQGTEFGPVDIDGSPLEGEDLAGFEGALAPKPPSKISLVDSEGTPAAQTAGGFMERLRGIGSSVATHATAAGAATVERWSEGKKTFAQAWEPGEGTFLGRVADIGSGALDMVFPFGAAAKYLSGTGMAAGLESTGELRDENLQRQLEHYKRHAPYGGERRHVEKLLKMPYAERVREYVEFAETVGELGSGLIPGYGLVAQGSRVAGAALKVGRAAQPVIGAVAGAAAGLAVGDEEGAVLGAAAGAAGGKRIPKKALLAAREAEKLADISRRAETFADAFIESAQKSASRGATFDPQTGKSLAGTDAYAVSAFKDAEKQFDAVPTREQVVEYMARNADLFADSRVKIGLWEDSGKWYLDAVVTPKSGAAAQILAQRARQKAYADLRKINPATGEAGEGAFLMSHPELKDAFPNRKAALNYLDVIEGKVEGLVERLKPLFEAEHIYTTGRDADPRVWYAASKELADIVPTKEDQELLATLFAVTSANRKVEGNATLALKAFKWVKEGVPLTDPRWVEGIPAEGVKGFTKGQHDAILAVLGEKKDPAAAVGPKVWNFWRAMLGAEDAVVVDLWVGKAYGVPTHWSTPKKPGGKSIEVLEMTDGLYAVVEQKLRADAKAAGVTPRLYQERVWRGMKVLTEGGLPRGNKPWTEAIRDAIARDTKKPILEKIPKRLQRKMAGKGGFGFDTWFGEQMKKDPDTMRGLLFLIGTLAAGAAGSEDAI